MTTDIFTTDNIKKEKNCNEEQDTAVEHGSDTGKNEERDKPVEDASDQVKSDDRETIFFGDTFKIEPEYNLYQSISEETSNSLSYLDDSTNSEEKPKGHADVAATTIEINISKNSIPWYNGCLYSCQLCKRQFFEKVPFKQHVENVHEIFFEEYQEKHEEQGTLKNTHECEVCGKGVLWNKGSLERHITKQHDITLEKFLVTSFVQF